ncbi:hypothetical protein KVG95_21265 [Pseudomonas sp. SWRI79]|uniref:Uncharacterized protein n=1 Tax=Pseudomonas farris TaxID=2841207 RepID=A0ABS6PZH6_9PSED|nr:hypothetical protein [Pseudomonas farris]MBV4465861.1 hypothetical protein [Pseudomonas farris]
MNKAFESRYPHAHRARRPKFLSGLSDIQEEVEGASLPRTMDHPNYRESAEQLVGKMKVYEPAVTQLLKDVTEKLGAELYGLEYRLKTPESLSEKLKIAKPEDVNDVLRYTIGFPYGKNGEDVSVAQQQDFVSGVFRTLFTLRKSGYSPAIIRNTFYPAQAYKGINANFLLPDQSSKFEIQMHTEQSYKTKSEGHVRYEEIRELERGLQTGLYEKSKANEDKLLALKANHVRESDFIETPRGIQEWIPSIGAKNLDFKWKNTQPLTPREASFIRSRIRESMLSCNGAKKKEALRRSSLS